MAEEIYQRFVQILDDTQFQAALKAQEKQEKVLAALRTAGGTAAVKAYNDTERAAKKAAQEEAAAAKRAAAEEAAAAKASAAEQARQAKYLNDLKMRYLAEQERAAKQKATEEERAAKRAAAGPSAWTLALKENTAAQQAQVKSLSDFRGQVNLGLESLGKFGGALSLIDGRLGAMAAAASQGIGSLSGLGGAAQLAGPAVGAVATGLGAVGLVISPLIISWLDYAEAQKMATAAAKTFREAQDGTLSLLEKATDDVRQLTQIQRGYSDVEKQADAITRGYAKQREDANAAHQEAIDIIGAQLGLTDNLAEVNARLIEQGKDEVDTVRKGSAAWTELRGVLDQHIAAMNDVDKAAEDGAAAALLVLEYNTTQTETENELAQAIRDRAKAEKTATEATKDYAAWRSRTISILKEEADERKRVRSLEMEQIQDAKEAEQQALIDVGLAREERFLREQEQHQEYLRMAKERADAEIRAIGNVGAAAGSVADIFGTYYDGLTEDTENMTEGQKEQALRAWKINRALAMSQITLSNIQAVAAALATPPAPNLIAGAAAGLAGAAQLAAAGSSPPPSFDDTPGPVYAASGRPVQQDRAQVSLHRDDIMIAGKTPASVMAQAATMAGSRRPLLGPQLARVPVGRLLTSDVERATRGRLPR